MRSLANDPKCDNVSENELTPNFDTDFAPDTHIGRDIRIGRPQYQRDTCSGLTSRHTIQCPSTARQLTRVLSPSSSTPINRVGPSYPS